MNILLSIKPEYAKLIYEGKKTIEWRKDFPKFVDWRSKIFLYETAPVKRVTGYVYFNELKKYGSGKIILGWYICEPTKLNIEEFGNLKYYTDNGKAPQSWKYTRADINNGTFFSHKIMPKEFCPISIGIIF